MEETYTLHELNQQIRQVVALNFPEPVWVRAEVAQQNESRGHRYLELVQKEAGGEVLAQSSAVLWRGKQVALARKRGLELNSLLQAGQELRLLARVDFHERYGLKLMIEDVDLSFTMGQLEKSRLEALQRLRELDLLDRNARLPLPRVLQRLAVISSPAAAGWKDFRHQLRTNSYGYAYSVRLFPAAMQGSQTEPEVLAQLESIRRRLADFDAVVLIRGGGSRLDLAAFDQFALSRGIAEFPLPVLTGIGHEVDSSLVDGVAHTSLKTPTAVAEFILDRNLAFETGLMETGLQLHRLCSRELDSARQALQYAQGGVQSSSRQLVQRAAQMLDFIGERIGGGSREQLRAEMALLQQLEKEVEALDPQKVLQRGYTLTLRQGLRLFGAAGIRPGEELTTRFSDGSVRSRVLPPEADQQ